MKPARYPQFLGRIIRNQPKPRMFKRGNDWHLECRETNITLYGRIPHYVYQDYLRAKANRIRIY